MKKTIVVSLFALVAFFNVNAQSTSHGFKKGDFYISGILGINSEKIDKQNTTGFEFQPSFGYLINDNLALGVSVGYGLSKKKLDTAVLLNTSAISTGIFATYYFNPSGKFSFFGTAGFDYGVANDKLSDAKITAVDFSVTPGISYFVSNKLAIQASVGRLGFTSEKSNISGTDPVSTIDLNMDFTRSKFGVIIKL